MAYRIITDTGCDLWQEFYQRLSVQTAALTVNFNQQDIKGYEEGWLKEFYDGLRQGARTQTSAINPEGWKEVITKQLDAGEDALVLTFSSGLSTTYQSAVIAATELQEEYPYRKIFVVDTLCASMGQGLLVYLACQKRDEGMSLEALHKWCEEKKLQLCHWFTVDDLMFLKRGGRINAATALVGTMLQTKPVMHVDNEGHLVKVSTVRGRKAAIDALVKQFAHTALPGENDTVFISHGDCIDDARNLEATLRQKYGVKNVVTYYIGAVIGSHSGPGTLALFFLGKNR